jgi:uncharacterized SAM-binding protein YcdF (DUF218 family)
MAVALRTLATNGGGRLVISGHAGEAARLAALAPEGVDISIESTARSTLENVERSLPFLLGAERLAVASDRFHQRRAVHYLRAVEPSLATRVIPPEYGWRDGWLMDAGGVLYESLLRLRRGAKQMRNRSLR